MEPTHLGYNMNIEQNFLVRYGLHNFVSCSRLNGKSTFFIEGMESQSMISHAEFLIKENFGDVMAIQRV